MTFPEEAEILSRQDAKAQRNKENFANFASGKGILASSRIPSKRSILLSMEEKPLPFYLLDGQHRGIAFPPSRKLVLYQPFPDSHTDELTAGIIPKAVFVDFDFYWLGFSCQFQPDGLPFSPEESVSVMSSDFQTIAVPIGRVGTVIPCFDFHWGYPLTMRLTFPELSPKAYCRLYQSSEAPKKASVFRISYIAFSN